MKEQELKNRIEWLKKEIKLSGYIKTGIRFEGDKVINELIDKAFVDVNTKTKEERK